LARPDLKVIPFRGNVGTRLKKMKAGEVAATLLAVAGLNRLGLQNEITSYLDLEEMIPAPGQGAVAIETREGDAKAADFLSPLGDPETKLAVRVERAISLGLGASCRMPLGAMAQVSGNQITARATLFSPDGKSKWGAELNGPASAPEALGSALAGMIKDKADPKILETYKIF
jgi:hydroxymethylbilane synthase